MHLFHLHWNSRWALALVALLLYLACTQIKASTCACERFGGCRENTQCQLNRDQKQICNVALGKHANVSSRLNNINEESGPACLAVNGKNGTNFRPISKYPLGPNCVHTADDDKNPYWEVDLGENYSIVSIVVYGTLADKAKHLKYATVTVDNEWCYNFSSKPEIPTVFDCKTSLVGRFVKISKTRYDENEYFLTLCEVQVWACKLDYCGPKCSPCNQLSGIPTVVKCNMFLADRVVNIYRTQQDYGVYFLTLYEVQVWVSRDTCDRTLLVVSLVIIFILAVLLTLAAIFIRRQKKRLHQTRNARIMEAKRETRIVSDGGNNFLATVSGSSSAAVTDEVCEAGIRCAPGPVYTNYENSAHTTNIYECLNAESDDNTACGYTTLMALM